MEIYYIYKATCVVNNKVYVGFCTDFNHRRRTHKYAAFVKNKNTPFCQGLRQYGWESFEWMIVYCSTDKDYTLQAMEPHFIQEYNSLFPNGFNVRKGGGFVPSKTSQNAQIRFIIFPDKHQEKIFNLSQFCREHNLAISAMSKVTGTGIPHKGYRCAKQLEDLKVVEPYHTLHHKKSRNAIIKRTQTRRENGSYDNRVSPMKGRQHTESAKEKNREKHLKPINAADRYIHQENAFRTIHEIAQHYHWGCDKVRSKIACGEIIDTNRRAHI
jgi:group I intron endonuclease